MTRTAGCAVLLAALLAMTVRVAIAENPPPIVALRGLPIAEAQWHGSIAVPSGFVEFATWGDLVFQVERTIDDRHRLRAFARVGSARLPVRGEAPEQPVWMSERIGEKLRSTWRDLGIEHASVVSLEQGDWRLAYSVAPSADDDYDFLVWEASAKSDADGEGATDDTKRGQ